MEVFLPLSQRQFQLRSATSHRSTGKKHPPRVLSKLVWPRRPVSKGQEESEAQLGGGVLVPRKHWLQAPFLYCTLRILILLN